MNSIRLLLNSVIDYAGLFPPAGLGMAESVHNYAAYRDGELSWALGRFIVPISRLDEFEACTAELQLPRRGGRNWRLSVLGGADPKIDLEQIIDFSRRHGKSADAADAVIDAFEWKLRSVAEIESSMSICSDRLETYFEIPLSDDSRALIAEVARTGGRAKVRTGGVTREMFPSPAQLAGFILLCAEARVPFKATAGLHHPLRSIHPLTYEPSSPSGVMHGFLNVLIASAFAFAGADVKVIEAILREESIGAFSFDDGGIRWRDQRLTGQQLIKMREQLFVSFGACSFQEPTSEMKALKLI